MVKHLLIAAGLVLSSNGVLAGCAQAVNNALQLPEAKPEIIKPKLRRLTVVVCHEKLDATVEVFLARLHPKEKYHSGIPSSSLYRVSLASENESTPKSTGVLFGDKDKAELLNVSLRFRNQAGDFKDVAGNVVMQGKAVQQFSKQGLTVAIKEWK